METQTKTIKYPENAIVHSPQMRFFMCECGYNGIRSNNNRNCKCGKKGTFLEQTVKTTC